jgi:hypothetical protein
MTTIKNKYIIEVTDPRFDKTYWYNGSKPTYWYNGSKPFVDIIEKAFICSHKKSAEENYRRVTEIYGYKCKIVPLEIKIK